MRWPAQPIHFLDFEGSLSSGVLEYGVVRLDHGAVTATWTRLCAARGSVRPEDAAVHGLTPEVVAGAAPLADDFAQFVTWREAGPLAAHFASAENTLIKSVWSYPRAVPDFLRPGASVAEWGPWIDTGRLYPQLYPDLGSARLEELVVTFGLQAELDDLAARHCPAERRRYHAALYDALAGALLLARLAREPGVADRPLAWLLTMSTLDAVKRQAWQQRELF